MIHFHKYGASSRDHPCKNLATPYIKDSYIPKKVDLIWKLEHAETLCISLARVSNLKANYTARTTIFRGPEKKREDSNIINFSFFLPILSFKSLLRFIFEPNEIFPVPFVVRKKEKCKLRFNTTMLRSTIMREQYDRKNFNGPLYLTPSSRNSFNVSIARNKR